MKIFAFIQYFFYLGLNWNWRIASHILIHEIKGERQYGIHTTGADELKTIAASGIDISHATVYMPASYLLLKEVFTELPANQRSHFLDIGCGKGRALCVAAHNGFGKVSGIDFSRNFCTESEKNLLLTKRKFPSLIFSTITKDAAKVEIQTDVDCIFLFNPFDEIIMKRVIKNIQHSFSKKPRTIHIIYLNPLYKKEFTAIGFKEIFYTCKMKYMEAVILKKSGTKS